MTQAQPEPTALFAPRAPRVLVGDTGVLMKDVLRSCRNPQMTSLQAGIHRGVARLYIASHVVGEMERNLAGFASERGCAHDALAHWRREYLPWLYVVDVPRHWAVQEPAVKAVMDRHPVDCPTAQLAAVLGCPTLAEDSDLLDNGFGSPDWLRLTLHTGGLAFQSQTMQGIYIPSAMAMELARAGTRAFVRAPTWLQVLALGAFLWIARAARDSDRIRTQFSAVGRGVLQAADWVMPRLEQLRDWQAAGEQEWDNQTVVAGDPVDVEQALARVLSRTPDPSLAADLACCLALPGNRQQRATTVRGVLQASSAFTERTRARWQLGHLGAPERPVDDELARRRVGAYQRTLARLGAHSVAPLSSSPSPGRPTSVLGDIG